ncbi:MAG: hypothetical protein Q9216_004876 [Gyalolechia sp. 2 TL-2023]
MIAQASPPKSPQRQLILPSDLLPSQEKPSTHLPSAKNPDREWWHSLLNSLPEDHAPKRTPRSPRKHSEEEEAECKGKGKEVVRPVECYSAKKQHYNNNDGGDKEKKKGRKGRRRRVNWADETTTACNEKLAKIHDELVEQEFEERKRALFEEVDRQTPRDVVKLDKAHRGGRKMRGAMERSEKPTEDECLTPLTDIDVLYIVLWRDHGMFTRNNSFENIRERLTFLHAFLDPANGEVLTDQQKANLRVSAYHGKHPRCNELRLPGCEEITNRSTVEKDIRIRRCLLWKEGNYHNTREVRDFYPKVAFMRFCDSVTPREETESFRGPFRGIGGDFEKDMESVHIFNEAHRLLCDGDTLEEDLRRQADLKPSETLTSKISRSKRLRATET